MSRKRTKPRYFLIIILLIISFIFRNNYYEYKLNHNVVKKQSVNIIDDSKSINSIDYLESLKNKNDNIKKIMDNKESYPTELLELLSRNLDMTDYVLNYLNFKGQKLSDNIGKVTKGEYPLLLQYDKRWGYGMYGNEVIAINGCGPTSVAIVIAGLTGRNDITPYNIATYSYQNGYYDVGTSWSFFTEGIKKYGIIGTELPLIKSKMIEELKLGHPIICSMGKGEFTTTGHIITIVGIKKDKFIINDPNSKKRSNKLWSYEEIENQIKNLWSFQTNE